MRPSRELRPGDAGRGVPGYVSFDVRADNRAALDASHNGDTTQLAVIDREGNMISATPSGGWIQSSPVIRGLGFPLGTRGQMSLPRFRPTERARPEETPACNADALACDEARPTVDGLRHTGGR